MSALVLLIHAKRVGVEISGVVEHVSLAVDVLSEVVVLRHFQQPDELGQGSDELRVGTVHQFHAAHLCQSNGSKRVY